MSDRVLHSRGISWGLALPFVALVRRELVRSLRRVRALVFLSALVAIAIYLLIDSWPPSTVSGMEMGWRSQGVLTVVAFTLYIGVVLLMPAYGATCMVVEREQNTYDLLALTLIRPAGILAGKLVNTLGLFVLFSVAMLPVVASLYFLVGIEPVTFLYVAGITAVTALWCAAVGLFCSVRFRGTVSAVLASYAYVVFLLGLYLIPVIFVMQMLRLRTYGPSFEHAAVILSSPVALGFALDNSLGPWDFAQVLCVQLFYTVPALFLAWWWLRRPREELRDDGPKTSLLARMRRRDPARDIHLSLNPAPIPAGGNPLAVKEIRWGALSNRRTRRRLFVYSAGIMCLLEFIVWVLATYNYPPPPEEVRRLGSFAWIIMCMVFTSIVAPALLANTLTKEYERENVDALRMTLLSPRQIIWGKALGGAYRALPLVLACLPSGILLPILVGYQYWIGEFVVCGLVSLAASFCLVMSLCLFTNLLTRRTPTAIMLAYALSWSVLFGVFFLAAMVRPHYLHYELVRSYYSTVGFFSPMIAFIDNLDQIRFTGSASSFQRAGGTMVTAYWLANIMFHLWVSALLLEGASRLFAKRRMRDP